MVTRDAKSPGGQDKDISVTRAAGSARDKGNAASSKAKKIDREWIESVKDYYYGERHKGNSAALNDNSGFIHWADLDKEQRSSIDSLMKEVDDKEELGTAVKLWQEIHKAWLQKTDTVEGDIARELLIRTSSENMSALEASNIARESLAHHANHYMVQFVDIFEGYGYFNGQEFNEREQKKEFKNPTIVKEYLKFLIDKNDLIKNREYSKEEHEQGMSFEQILDHNDSEAGTIMEKAMRHGQPITYKSFDFTLKNFYNSYNHMNTIHYANQAEAYQNRDYSRNDRIIDYTYNYMYHFSLFAYRGTLPRSEGKGVDIPPPPPPVDFDGSTSKPSEPHGESGKNASIAESGGRGTRTRDTANAGKKGNGKKPASGNPDVLINLSKQKGKSTIRIDTRNIASGKHKAVKIETDDGEEYMLAGDKNSTLKIVDVKDGTAISQVPVQEEEIKVGKEFGTMLPDTKATKGNGGLPRKRVSKITVYEHETQDSEKSQQPKTDQAAPTGEKNNTGGKEREITPPPAPSYTNSQQNTVSETAEYDAAKAAYRELIAKRNAGRKHFYADLDATTTPEDMIRERIPTLIKSEGNIGSFVVFTNSDGKSGYAFPNPVKLYRKEAIGGVFPENTEALFNGNRKESIEPVRVVKVRENWEVIKQ